MNDLLQAAKTGDLEKFITLHESGYDIHKLTPMGRGTLSVAAKYGHISIVDYIMRNMPNVNDSNVALGDAIRNKQLKVAELMICKYNVQGSFYSLEMSADNRYMNIIELLLKIQPDDNQLLLLERAIDKAQEDIIKFIVGRGGAGVGNPNILSRVMYEILKGRINKDILKVFVDNEININIELKEYNYESHSNYKYRLIHKILPFEELARYLITKGADVNCVDSNGNTPLHLLMKNTTITDIDKDMNVNAINNEGNTPLHILMENNKITDCEKIRLIELLINNGANINIQNNRGDTPLHILVRKDNTEEIIKFLIINCNANTEIYNMYGDSAIMIATPSIQDLIISREIEDT